MNRIIEFLKSKNASIIAVVGAVVLGCLAAFGVFVPPDWVWGVPAALGLQFIQTIYNGVKNLIIPYVSDDDTG